MRIFRLTLLHRSINSHITQQNSLQYFTTSKVEGHCMDVVGIGEYIKMIYLLYSVIVCSCKLLLSYTLIRNN